MLAFTGCEKENDIIPNPDNNIIKSGEYSEPTVINGQTIWGRFWTAELAVTGAHYPLEIRDDVYMWSAYINAGHDDRYAFSVRYVFEPTYQ